MSPKPVFEGNCYPLSTDVAVLVKRYSDRRGAQPSAVGNQFSSCSLWKNLIAGHAAVMVEEGMTVNVGRQERLKPALTVWPPNNCPAVKDRRSPFLESSPHSNFSSIITSISLGLLSRTVARILLEWQNNDCG